MLMFSTSNFIDKAEKYILLIDTLWNKHDYLTDLRNKLNNVIRSIETEKEVITKTQNFKTAEQYYSTVIQLNKKSSRIITVKDNLKYNNINLKHTVKIMSDTEKVFRAADISIEIEKLLDIVKKYTALNVRWKSINQQINLQKRELETYSQLKKAEDCLKGLSKKVLKLSAVEGINNSLTIVESL